MIQGKQTSEWQISLAVLAVGAVMVALGSLSDDSKLVDEGVGLLKTVAITYPLARTGLKVAADLRKDKAAEG